MHNSRRISWVLQNHWRGLTVSRKKRHVERGNPVDLEGYLDQLAAVSSRDAPAQTRLDLYKKMYTAPSYLKNPEINPLTEQAIVEASASLEVKNLSCQDFQERDVLRGVNAILSAHRNIRGANEARDIYFTRCWV